MTDLLLEWMSFRKWGRTSDIPSAIIGDRPRRQLDHLVTLGHAEWEQEDKWRVAAPTLAGSSDETHPFALLCGARTPVLLDKLTHAAALHGATIEHTPASDLPTVIKVRAASFAVFASIGASSGIRFQPNTAFALLACTPTIATWKREPCEMVRGRVTEVRRFSGSRLLWVESSLDEATTSKSGFFKIKRDFDWVRILKTSASDCAYIDERVGRLAAAVKLKWLRFDSNAHSLMMPGRLYPPTLIARALALCTGELPRFDSVTRELAFPGVTAPIFRMVEAITGLRSK